MLAAIAAAWGSRGGGEGWSGLVGRSLQMFFVVCFQKMESENLKWFALLDASSFFLDISSKEV